MLKLEPLSNASKRAHLELMQDRFYVGLLSSVAKLEADGASYDRNLICFLHDRLEDVLLGSPRQLEQIALDVGQAFASFATYAAKRQKGREPRDEVHRHTLSIVNACFDYDWFSDQSDSWGAYALVAAHGLRVCPYCQAHHVNYHFDPSQGRAGELKMRPPLDHYLPKAKYPFLAVSLQNLIPSCSQCNSSIKKSSDPIGLKLPHPMDAKHIRIKFSAKGTIPAMSRGTVEDVVVRVEGLNAHSRAHIDEFRLQDRYAWYRHEIKDLFDRHAEHGGLPEKFRSFIPRELYVLGFLEENAMDRALGLCLRDIYRELTLGKVV